MKGPDEVPGVVLPVPGDHAAGGHHPVAHPLQTVQNLKWFFKISFWVDILNSTVVRIIYRITVIHFKHQRGKTRKQSVR